jgi:hypothetical protein
MVMVCGMPKRQIQAEQSASAHAAAVVVDSGTASVHRVVLSAMVKMWVQPCEGGRGPSIGQHECGKNDVQESE